MVDINDRIEKLGKYFVSFNIADGVAYALVDLPKTWNVPMTLDYFKVKTAKKEDKGFYFFSEVSEGIGNIFKAIDSVIELNKEYEEKKALLVEKANEMKELFAVEPLEKLRRLEFTFARQKKQKAKKKVEKIEQYVPSEDEQKSLVDEVLEKADEVKNEEVND